MKNLFLALSVVSIASFMSCEKEKESEQNETIEANFRTGGFENPLEWVGVAHNDILQHLIDIEASDYTDGQTYAAAYLGCEVTDFAPADEVEPNLAIILDPDQDYLAGLSLDAEIIDVYYNIEDILFTSATVNSDLDDLAESVYLSETFVALDKDLLLGSIAVAKHSSNYWEDEEEEIASIFGRIWADMKGFVDGFKMRAIYGRLSNGVFEACKASHEKKKQSDAGGEGPVPTE